MKIYQIYYKDPDNPPSMGDVLNDGVGGKVMVNRIIQHHNDDDGYYMRAMCNRVSWMVHADRLEEAIHGGDAVFEELIVLIIPPQPFWTFTNDPHVSSPADVIPAILRRDLEPTYTDIAWADGRLSLRMAPDHGGTEREWLIDAKVLDYCLMERGDQESQYLLIPGDDSLNEYVRFVRSCVPLPTKRTKR